MSTDIVIIGIKEMMELYNFTSKEAYRLVMTRGCPVLPRRRGGPYKVIKDEFESWLRGRRA